MADSFHIYENDASRMLYEDGGGMLLDSSDTGGWVEQTPAAGIWVEQDTET